MKQYTRQTPQFSLCGLNCSLCPRFRTTGSSRCPGCGGEDFYEKHPTCGVISCSQRHGGVEYCFECSDYPCDRYTSKNDKDSFISYMNGASDMETAKTHGLPYYLDRLSRKSEILDVLLRDWDNGRLKAYFCRAVNVLPLEDLELAMSQLTKTNGPSKSPNDLDPTTKGKFAKDFFDKLAAARGISLQLRR